MYSTEAKTMQVQPRWMVRRDLPEVLEIEQKCFEIRWSEEDFLTCLRHRTVIGMVAIDEREIVRGYMIYELHAKHLELLNFAVDPASQRQGVGSAMIEKLVHKLQQQKRTSIRLCCRESNLPAQLFFRSMGFVAKLVRNFYVEPHGEDAYQFTFRLKTAAELANPYRAGNRISEFLD